MPLFEREARAVPRTLMREISAEMKNAQDEFVHNSREIKGEKKAPLLKF